MKRIFTLAIIAFFLSITESIYAQNSDYLLSTTSTGNGITTDNSKNWTDLTSVTIDVTNISNLLVSASINMRPDGSDTKGREAHYNIYQSDNILNESGLIQREIIKTSETGVESWGIGTLVHIFDVSALSGNKTFVIQHRNYGSSKANRNIYSTVRLTAIALTTKINQNELSNSVKRLTSYDNTTSNTYVGIIGLTTDAIELPIKGDIYVAASINSKASVGNTSAEYQLQYSADGGVNYSNMGNSVVRTMYGSFDDGMVSLVGILQNQDPDNDFMFRVLHRRSVGVGTVSSGNANLLAIALAHDGGGSFESIYSEQGPGVSITGVSTLPQSVNSVNFTTTASINSINPSVYVHAQYELSASGLDASVNPDQRMRAQNQMFLTAGGITQSAEKHYRYISDNTGTGSGGFIGLAENLTPESILDIGMQHSIEYISNPDLIEDEVLTTSSVILCGFQTVDKSGFIWNGSVSDEWELDANWDSEVAPTLSSHHVTIPNVITQPIITGSVTRECAAIILNSGATLAIADNSTLKVANNISNNGTLFLGHSSSLVQTHAGSDENSGYGTYQIIRNGTSSSYGYNIWASPVQSASITSTFDGINPCDIWVFDTQNQNWNHDFTVGFSTTCYGNPVTFSATDVITGGDGLMDIGRGYFVPGNISPIKTFTGQIFNGDLSVPINTTNLGNPGGSNWTDDDWNLIGNPYPSALNATAFWNENAFNNERIINGLYFWDEADTTGGYNQYSDYASWNLTGGVNSGNSVRVPTGHIASGQGFWVYAKSNTNVIFNNSMRSDSNNQFFKDGPSENHNIWLSFTTPSNYQNNILIGYNKNSTDQIDNGYDAHKLIGNSHVKLASFIDTEEFVIQSFAPINIGKSKNILLVATSDESGIHTFSSYKKENIPENIHIILYDKELGIKHDIMNQDYHVSLTANVEYTTRFELIFTNEYQMNNGSIDIAEEKSGTKYYHVNSTNETTEDHFSVVQYSGIIELHNPNGIQGTIQLFDITGKSIRVIEQTEMAEIIKIDSGTLKPGIYFIQISSNNKSIYHRKILQL
jgi:hypothetical protein